VKNENLWIDLSDIELDDIEVLSQQGGRGIPEFAASSGTICCSNGACSCCDEEGRGTAA
jgi:thiazolylpeptide-type bacteriocin precursor